MLSTIQAYFEGRRDLFDGLEIQRLEKEWTSYPVLHLKLSRGDVNDFSSETRNITEWKIEGD